MKKNLFVYAAILPIFVACMAYFLPMDKQFLKDLYRNFYNSNHDSAMSLDLGFSHLRNVSLDESNWTVWGNISGLLLKTPKIIFEKFRGFPSRPTINTLHIAIKFRSYQQLLNDREQAMEKGILQNPKKLKAKIFFNGKQYKTELRLKGDKSEHWRSEHRMSLRVALKGNKNILGFKKFSLHKMEARQFPFDHVFQSTIRRLGNLSSVHKYVRVVINGVSWGIMNIEEHMSKELLEKQGRKDSIIMKFGNEKIWTLGQRSYPHYRLSDSKLNIKLYSQNKYLKNRIFREWFTYVSEKRLNKENDELYSFDHYAMALILAKVWNNTHTLKPSNARHYFNPYLLKLEPITADQGHYALIREDDKTAKTQDEPSQFNPIKFIIEDIYQHITETDKYKKNFNANFLSVVNALKNIEDEFSIAQIYFPINKKIIPDILSVNKRILSETSDSAISKIIPEAKEIDKLQIINRLPTDLQAKEFSQHLLIRHYEDGELKIFNLLPDTVNLKSLILDETTELNLDVAVPGFLPGNYKPFIYQTKLRGIYDNRIISKTEYKGNDLSLAIGPTFLKGLRNPLLPTKVKNNREYLKETDENVWLIRSGIWNIDEPIVIHGDLTIEKGAELYFTQDSYLIVIGSIQAKGTLDSKIVFAPQNKSWKGIYVIGDGDKSSELKNVIVKSTSGLKHGMLNLSGGVTFYHANVEIEGAHFEKTLAEDALNIVKSNFSLNDIRFHGTSSDALDSDFSSGKIVNSVFNVIGGDALDFSGSRCTIKNVEIFNVQDKAFSVGEVSTITIEKAQINKIGIGIASKDGSSATISNSKIENYTLHAAMTYNKKGFYEGQPRIELYETEVDGDHPFAKQEQTSLLVNGVEFPAGNIDVQALYQSEKIQN